MKKLGKILMLFLSCVLVSCEKEPILTISVEQIAAPANGNSTSVIVTTNNPWTVSGNDWCTVSPSSGDGGSTTVTVTVKKNTTYDPRTCVLTFMSEGLTASISVSQETNYGIILPKNTFEISSEAQQISVEVKANVEYDVSTSVDWITQMGTKALVANDFKFKIAENTSYDNREGIITIKEKKGSITEVIKVKQVQNDALIISSKEYNLSSAAQTLEVSLQTNVELDIIIPELAKSWVRYKTTKSLNNKIVCLDVDANPQNATRSAAIIFKKRNAALADTIKIIQAAKDILTVFQKDYELTGDAQTLEIKLQSNANLDVKIPVDAKKWISVYSAGSTKSLRDDAIILLIQNNSEAQDRAAMIRICTPSGVYESILIYQHKATVDISIEGTANCYVVDAPGWYKFKPTKGNSSDLISGGVSAKVLWETFNMGKKPNVGDLIDSVLLQDNEIVFKIPRNFKDGNAGVAIIDRNGSILWSWHIWITPYKAEILKGQKYKHNVGLFMDRNLGALSNEPDNLADHGSLRSVGLLYQWGRKDPFPGIYDDPFDSFPYARSTAKWPEVQKQNDMSHVENPMIYFTDWLDNNNIGVGLWDHRRKTIYDPCPAGWKVPSNIWCEVFQQVDEFDGSRMFSKGREGYSSGHYYEYQDGYYLDIVESGDPAWYGMSIMYGFGSGKSGWWTSDWSWENRRRPKALRLGDDGRIEPNWQEAILSPSSGLHVRCQKIE